MLSVATQLYTIRDKCRLCPSKNLELAFPMIPVPLGDGYVPYERRHEVEDLFPLEIMFCADCGNVQTGIDINLDLVYRDYIWTTSCSPGLVNSYKKYVDDLTSRFFPEGKEFAIEIGSNDGTFSKFLQNKGIRVLGVEPANRIAAISRAAGVETIADFFTPQIASAVKEEHGRANLIVANHVFPNANDADSIVEGIRELLHPEGILSLQIFYLLDVIGKNLLENFNHEHTSYLYMRTLKSLFERHGLEVFDFEHVETKGGSLRCFVQHHDGPHNISDRIDVCIEKELALGLHKASTYSSVSHNIEETRKTFGRFFDECSREGKKVAAYGTSIGATMFAYQYKMGDGIQFFVDDDPARHNLVSPGLHIPVKGPEAIYHEEPDYVVVMAPLYADLIIGKHQEYLKQGGHFVKFRPQFEII